MKIRRNLVVVEVSGGVSDSTEYGEADHMTFDWDNLKEARTRRELVDHLHEALQIPAGEQRRNICAELRRLIVVFDKYAKKGKANA